MSSGRWTVDELSAAMQRSDHASRAELVGTLQSAIGNSGVQRLVSSGASLAPSPTLRIGSRSPAVANLQTLLNQHGASLVVDGAFGPGTAAAVVGFQRRAALVADGVVGAKTWSALRAAGGASGGPGGGSASLPSPRQAAVMAKVKTLKRLIEQGTALPSAEQREGQPSPSERPTSGHSAGTALELSGFLDDLESAWDEVTDTVSGVADSVGETVGGVVDAVGETVGGAVDAVGDAVGGAVDAVGDAVGGAVDAVGDAVGGAVDTVAGWGKEVVADAGELGNTIATAADDLRTRFGEQVDVLLQAVEDLGRGMWPDLDGLEGLLDRFLRGLAAAATNADMSGGDPDELGPCDYVVEYANEREVGCSSKGCGGGIAFDVAKITAMGPGCPTDLTGVMVTETISTDDGCMSIPPDRLIAGAGCPAKADGTLSECTDTYRLCMPKEIMMEIPELFRPFCTQKLFQTLYVNGEPVDARIITFEVSWQFDDRAPGFIRCSSHTTVR